MIPMMAGLMDTVRGTANTFNGWASKFAGVEATKKPTAEKTARIVSGYNRWFERECARPGATVQGAPPEAVDAALQKQTHAEIKALRDYFASEDVGIQAERARLFAETSAAYESLVAKMEELREFDQQYVRFAIACRVNPPAPIADEAIAGYVFRNWRDRAMQRLYPPQPKPPATATENPLVLT